MQAGVPFRGGFLGLQPCHRLAQDAAQGRGAWVCCERRADEGPDAAEIVAGKRSLDS